MEGLGGAGREVGRQVASPGAGSAAMTGAQFEIRIEGTPRTYRDRKDYAMEGTRLIKSRNPHSKVEVKDLRRYRGASQARVSDALEAPPDRSRIRHQQGPA
jgi:hypothetical protein